jgi:AcrR family transcriptional regulator
MGIWKIVMLQNGEAVRRARGRPQIRCDDETRDLVTAAAAEEFQSRGYAATGMGAVAQRAGVSTKTLYRLFPAKDALFGQVISQGIGRFMLAVDPATLDRLGLTEGLERILIAYGNLTLAAETIAIYRLVIGEGDRFPEIARLFHEVAIVNTSGIIQSWLDRQTERGLLRLEDTQTASGMLRGMMTEQPRRAVMLGQRAAPGAEEIAGRARACARLFLHGCAV